MDLKIWNWRVTQQDKGLRKSQDNMHHFLVYILQYYLLFQPSKTFWMDRMAHRWFNNIVKSLLLKPAGCKIASLWLDPVDLLHVTFLGLNTEMNNFLLTNFPFPPEVPFQSGSLKRPSSSRQLPSNLRILQNPVSSGFNPEGIYV